VEGTSVVGMREASTEEQVKGFGNVWFLHQRRKRVGRSRVASIFRFSGRELGHLPSFHKRRPQLSIPPLQTSIHDS
jgi:hypothetical protein